MPRNVVKELIELCHSQNVLVSTGGFTEYVLAQGNQAFDKYINECKELGFDLIEIATGFIAVPMRISCEWLRR
jgi:phosphosulfolactate synthase (CoM biosynthesis protein A)